jgi:serine/threonine-protein kinase
MTVPVRDPREFAQKRVGQMLNHKWMIDRVVDVGGMAVVYAATHRNGKRVAVKMLLPQFATNQDVIERFLREGYVANQVEHRGAVQILDDDVTPEGAPFLVMELLDGESLDKWLDRAGGRIPILDTLALSDQVLDTLYAFHARAVVHRDIKPGNLFITKEGVVKVLDFGLARLRDPRIINVPTASGIVMGTAAYMPPEQAQGKPDQIDQRTDIFAVGAVMFHALTGRVVHQGRTPTDRLLAAMKNPAPLIGTIDASIPKWVQGIVDKALSFDKFERWETAREMREQIRGCYAELVKTGNAATQAPTPLPEGASPESKTGSDIFEPSVVVDVSFGDIRVPKA